MEISWTSFLFGVVAGLTIAMWLWSYYFLSEAQRLYKEILDDKAEADHD